MRVIYNIVILQIKSLLFILKFFNSKIRSFVEERKKVLEILEKGGVLKSCKSGFMFSMNCCKN